MTVRVRAENGIAVWSAGSRTRALDVWFHPAFGDSHASYQDALASPLLEVARVFAFDPPGHGASPPRPRGLTLRAAARAWADLVARFSGARPVVLVGHSMAGIIASEAAVMLARAPALVVSLEGNLLPADAYYSGQAARHATPARFHAALGARLQRASRASESLRRFASSLATGDPRTLWTLGRSAVALKDPGAGFRRLRCPKIYYWDSTGARIATFRYLRRHEIPHRRLDGLGHWPMVEAPAAFYAALAEDIRRLALPSAERGRDAAATGRH